MSGYAELQVTTNYSFLRGASHPEELFATARLLGLPVLGITDRNTLAGIVRSHQRAEEAGVRMLTGCRLDLRDGPSLLVYPQHKAGYARLCRLLSLGKGRAGKGACDLACQDVAAHAEGLLAVLVPNQIDEALPSRLARLRRDFEQHLSVRWSADHGNRWTSRFRFPLAVEGEGSGSGKSRGAVAV